MCFVCLDLSDIRSLVDLTMASESGTMEVAKLSTLHTAVMGFATLIYDLPQNADYIMFLNCCTAVWKNLDADNKLAEKLVMYQSITNNKQYLLFTCSIWFSGGDL